MSTCWGAWRIDQWRLILTELSPAETDTLHRIAGMLLPPSEEYGVPGANDPLILADIIRSIGRDAANIRAALAELAPLRQDADIASFVSGTASGATLGRVILQCYYRDDRVLHVARPGTAAAVPEGAHAGTGRLVPAGPGAHPRPNSGATTGRLTCATHRNDIVDVLIIGSGASGAAVAWSLAETKMRILCLEQGDWMKHTDFPSQRPRLGGAALH